MPNCEPPTDAPTEADRQDPSACLVRRNVLSGEASLGWPEPRASG